jgi:NADPH-dependent 2,4-dienoyl-CoA reductase/sulfur reductase-like enzyme
MSNYKYVILGGGLTAGYAAQEYAEQGGHSGELCIVSAENTLPYERPPLSKDFLAGEESTDDILINEPAFYKEHGVDVKLNTVIKDVDFDEKRLYADDDEIAFEKLLIATGSRPRQFNVPGADLDNIFYLRHVEDARQIRKMAEKVNKAVVIGGGFIAMETTAVLQSQGVHTTMLFPEERVWQHFFTPIMSAFFENYYRDRGVTIMPRQKVNSFMKDHRSIQVITKSGLNLPADMVVAGIGVTPNYDLFADSGLELADDGIPVNRFLETNLPDVFAAGDITRYKDVIYERPLHIEHWDNARAQGQHAIRTMLGKYQPYEHVPYFFSDVFDLSYEFWGDPTGAAETVYRGDVENGRFSVWWLAEDGSLLAAFVMDRPEEERELAPKWIKTGKKLSASWLQEAKQLHAEEESDERVSVLS